MSVSFDKKAVVIQETGSGTTFGALPLPSVTFKGKLKGETPITTYTIDNTSVVMLDQSGATTTLVALKPGKTKLTGRFDFGAAGGVHLAELTISVKDKSGGGAASGPSAGHHHNKKLSTGAIVGIAVGAAVLLAIIIAVSVMIGKKNENAAATSSTTMKTTSRRSRS